MCCVEYGFPPVQCHFQQQILMCVCCASRLPPPGPAVPALALSGIRPATVRNLDWAFSKYSAFCVPRGLFIIYANTLNAFLAECAQFSPSDALAKTTRSALCWLADLTGHDRPVNRLTFRLVFAISKAYKAGNKPCLSLADYNKVKLLQSAFSASSASLPSFPLCLVNLLFLLGIRPGALHRVSASSFADGKFHAVNSKGFPNGISVFLPPAALPIIAFMSASFGSQPWYLNSSSGRDALLFSLQHSIASVPDVNLRTIRTFYATYLFTAKVPSAL